MRNASLHKNYGVTLAVNDIKIDENEWIIEYSTLTLLVRWKCSAILSVKNDLRSNRMPIHVTYQSMCETV